MNGFYKTALPAVALDFADVIQAHDVEYGQPKVRLLPQSRREIAESLNTEQGVYKHADDAFHDDWQDYDQYQDRYRWNEDEDD